MTAKVSEPEPVDWLGRLTARGAADCGVWLDSSEVSRLRRELGRLVADDSICGRVRDVESGLTRTIYGVHRLGYWIEALSSDQRLLDAAKVVLGEAVYLYQSKANPKASGSVGWDWHVDFQAWSRDDGMTDPNAITFGVFLDDVSKEAGPFTVLAGSHRYFGSWNLGEAKPVGGGLGAVRWHDDFGAGLKYRPPQELIETLVGSCEVDAFTGPAGTVVAFHAASVHGSGRNEDPTAERAIIYLTYNAESNRPLPSGMKRPDFIVER